jgi:hypothetical protein
VKKKGREQRLFSIFCARDEGGGLRFCVIRKRPTGAFARPDWKLSERQKAEGKAGII